MKNNNSSQDISWEEIQKYINQDIYQEFLQHIPLSIYKIALDKNDRPKVIAAVIKMLKEQDPQHATETHVFKMADRMAEVAKVVLNEMHSK